MFLTFPFFLKMSEVNIASMNINGAREMKKEQKYLR